MLTPYLDVLLVTLVKYMAIVYNVHALVHLADEVQLHGCLESFSAFPYESYLHKLKKLVRKTDFPLAQIIRRDENY